MNFWKMSPIWRLLFFGLLLLLTFIVRPDLFSLVMFALSEEFWLIAASIPLVMAIAVVAYLCRPSVRAAFALIYTLWGGNRAVTRGDYAQAEKDYCKAMAQADALGVNRDSFMGSALSGLGNVYLSQGRVADAEPIFKQALKHYEEESPAKPTARAYALHNLAAVYIQQGRFALAEPMCQEAIDIFVNAEHEYRAIAILNLGQALAGQERSKEAESAIARGLDLAGKQGERGQQVRAFALGNLADLCRRQGRLFEAEPLARHAVTLFEKTEYGPEHPTVSRLLNVLAAVVRQKGRLDEAESLCRRSQRLTEKAFGPGHIYLDKCLSTLARIRSAQGQHAEAEQLLRRCLSILDPVVVPDHRERVTRMEEYTALLRKMDRTIEAEQWETKLKQSLGARDTRFQEPAAKASAAAE